MDLFQLNIYANPLAYPFVIKSIKDFLNNNNLSIKKEGNLSINTYPKVSFEKHIMIETGYKKDEVKKICSRLPEFINHYNFYHPNNLDLNINLLDIKSQKEFQKSQPVKLKQIKWLFLITVISFIAGFLIANLKVHSQASIKNQELNLLLPQTSQEFEVGLAKYKNLPEQSAMLFDFKETTNQAFWMKNMSFPIDIFFLDQENKILDIQPNQAPCPLSGDCPKITSKYNYSKVIETKANFASQNSIQIGDQFNIQKTLIFTD